MNSLSFSLQSEEDMSEKTPPQWEHVSREQDPAGKTERLQVPGGWLYARILNDAPAIGMTFVPFPHPPS